MMPIALTAAEIRSPTVGMATAHSARATATPVISRVPAAGVRWRGCRRVQTGPSTPSRPIAYRPRAVGITEDWSEATAENISAISGSAASGWEASRAPKYVSPCAPLSANSSSGSTRWKAVPASRNSSSITTRATVPAREASRGSRTSSPMLNTDSKPQ